VARFPARSPEMRPEVDAGELPVSSGRRGGCDGLQEDEEISFV
jgi:hypothetical protein